eukprot:CAMPEP_0194406162 /NCGR_PEP_ID=MMETSP0176-20130528/4436_1 /TAXON_ID=216777 /ORGANISM="Proboscia alata, Strain PI-D3" /LENGTH=259 /DNA_ID=CAMNT_0039205277 /DNA_START=62 /DNA_END=841 /DNA_ORIENTATION=+
MAPQFLSTAAILVVALLTLHGATAFTVAGNSRQPATSLDAVSRREVIAATASAAMLAGVPMGALAGDGAKPRAEPDRKTAAKFFFNGVFRDKNHPDGYRILAGATGKPGTVTMQDYPGAEIFEIPLTAKKDEESGTVTVDMDLSVYKKSFPKSTIAKVTEDGRLEFPDGNVWKKDKGVAGLYIDGFAPYPKYRRIVIPTNKGKNVAVTMVSGKSTFQVDGVETKKGVTVVFPGDKTCTGKFDQKEGIITWLDGNVWTKV